MPSQGLYLVKIEFAETALRERIKELGGRWNGEKKVWIVSGAIVRRLRLEGRVVDWLNVRADLHR